MIMNPDHVRDLLGRWKDAPAKDASILAELLRRHLGPQTWEQFQETWHLYLQSIPMELAREAWGLTQTENPATQ